MPESPNDDAAEKIRIAVFCLILLCYFLFWGAAAAAVAKLAWRGLFPS